MKYCPGCKIKKEVSCFGNNKSRPDNLAVYCKPCANNFTKKFRQENPQKGLEYTKQWRINNPDKVAEQRKKGYAKHKNKLLAQGRVWRENNKERRFNAYLLRRFGITSEMYYTKLAQQNNTCAICSTTPEQNGKRLAVDHCHDTGIIRGLLCGPHNKALGLFKDSKRLLTEAIKYLDKYGTTATRN